MSRRTVTKALLRDLVVRGLAEDVTDYSFGEMRDLLRSIDKSVVGVACGTYGPTGVWFEDLNTGNHYVVRERNSALQMAL